VIHDDNSSPDIGRQVLQEPFICIEPHLRIGLESEFPCFPPAVEIRNQAW
jgi:hypothetical protein